MPNKLSNRRTKVKCLFVESLIGQSSGFSVTQPLRTCPMARAVSMTHCPITPAGAASAITTEPVRRGRGVVLVVNASSCGSGAWRRGVSGHTTCSPQRKATAKLTVEQPVDATQLFLGHVQLGATLQGLDVSKCRLHLVVISLRARPGMATRSARPRRHVRTPDRGHATWSSCSMQHEDKATYMVIMQHGSDAACSSCDMVNMPHGDNATWSPCSGGGHTAQW